MFVKRPSESTSLSFFPLLEEWFECFLQVDSLYTDKAILMSFPEGRGEGKDWEKGMIAD